MSTHVWVRDYRPPNPSLDENIIEAINAASNSRTCAEMPAYSAGLYSSTLWIPSFAKRSITIVGMVSIDVGLATRSEALAEGAVWSCLKRAQRMFLRGTRYLTQQQPFGSTVRRTRM